MTFRDRADAGRKLAERVVKLGVVDAVVVALPRGGVPVAFAMAQALKAPLDVLVVRKLGSPAHEGASLGAIAEGGIGYIDNTIVAEAGASRPEIEAIAQAELREVKRRVELWRGAWPPYPVDDKNVVLVDEGVVTGANVRAAVIVLRPKFPRSILLAVPVAPFATLESLSDEVDGIVCLRPETVLPSLDAVYDDLPPVSDHEVAVLLERAQAWTVAAEPRESA